MRYKTYIPPGSSMGRNMTKDYYNKNEFDFEHVIPYNHSI